MSVRCIHVPAFAVFLATAFSAGCGSKITEENFNKINQDMSLEDVEAILGKGEIVKTPADDANALMAINRMIPEEYRGKPVTVVKWQSGENVIYVYFVGEKRDKNIFKTAAFP